ncbi:MAG: ABC transporter permease [Anaerolineales bacterium]|nr:ABC transporter permease [Anaerolineales bacterium]
MTLDLAAESLAPARSGWARFFRNRAAAAGLAFIALAVLLALAGPGLYSRLLPAAEQKYRDGVYQDYAAINAGPSARHWLGADDLGRDQLARLLLALRASLAVALVVEVINVGLGGTLGLIAGYFGGAADFLIARLADILFAFPGLLLAILVSAVFGPAARELAGGLGRLMLVAAALSLVSWPLMARLVRGQVLALRQREFVLAAQSLGASSAGILVRHLLPNAAWLIIVAATLDVAGVIVNEATLSLLGLGIEEPGASLGLMIFKAVGKLERYPLQILLPAGTITLLVLAFSFLGDGLRDALDPGR